MESHESFFPKTLQYSRINDALILSADLPDVLIPALGQQVRTYPSLSKIFIKDDLIAGELQELLNIALQELADATFELMKFVGLISRLHMYIQKQEKYLPGVRTTIATGYRKEFIRSNGKQDLLSANFAFTNAYTAHSQLKGANLFLDNNILLLFSNNTYSKNTIKVATYLDDEIPYDPISEKKKRNFELRVGKSFNVDVLRQRYLYREMNPIMLSFLQAIPSLITHLEGIRETESEESAFGKVLFDCIKNGLTNDEITTMDFPWFTALSGAENLIDAFNMIAYGKRKGE